MPELKPTSFTAWNFTPEEERRAKVLPDLTLKYIQTELAVCAEKKLALTVDEESKDPALKLQLGNEYYRGAMEILGMLISNDENTRFELQQQLVVQRSSQADN